jgi:DNA-binding winged helix-turn-helix (wHTH) protein
LRAAVHFGPFVLDPETRQLTHNCAIVHLTPKAFDLLALLIAEAPRVVPKSELHDRLWTNAFVSDYTLVGLVKEVRRALGDEQKATMIRTAHRVGYAFAGDLRRLHMASPDPARWVVVGARKIVLNDGENLIGRGPESTIRLDIIGVSRRHARIVIGQRGAILEDLASKNGTTVNDQRVATPIELHDAARIEIAGVILIFHASSTNLSTETIGDSTVA